MKVAESSLVGRLDEVRPNGAAKITRDRVGDNVPARKAVPVPPARKTIVSYRTVAASTEARFSGIGKWLFFLLAVVVPTVLGGVYYAYFASPQYVSEFRFTVRPNMGSGSAAAVDAALAMSNSYIVSDYVNSRDAVVALEKAVDLRSLYAAESTDVLSRLKPEASIEDLIKYWNSRIHTSYDLTTGINIVEVSAFSPEAAQRIAAALKILCETLVNQISDGARKSQMEFARGELERSEARLKNVRLQETAMRTDQRTLDARKEADGRLQLNLKLRGELSTLQAQYDSLTTYMSPKSPKLTLLSNQIAATQEQISQLQAQVGGTDGKDNLSGNAVNASAISRFDQLQTDLEIASKLYESSLTAYEAARAQSSNSQIYLATYVQPGLAQNASYPRAFFDTFLIFMSALGIWVVLTLIYYSIRDHA